MRDLSQQMPTKLVKSGDHTPDFSSYLVVTVHDDMRLGEVYRTSGQATWTCCVVTTHPTYGEGLQVVGYRRTRSEAVERVVEAWGAQVDEEHAYKVLAAIQDGVTGAEELAAHQLANDPAAHLVDSGFLVTDGRFVLRFVLDASDVSLKGQRAYSETIVRRQLNGTEDLNLSSIESVTRRGRLTELELERREKQAQYEALIPSGDYREDDRGKAMSEREIREIPLTNEQGFWIGGVFQVIAGWRAVAANRIEILDRHGWNGRAYDTRADAEAALRAHDEECFGKSD